MNKSTNCPCGKNKTYSECCGKFHNNTKPAETAEELMRSRYCAYVKRQVSYLIDTAHPDTPLKPEYKELQQYIDTITFTNLEIIKCVSGQKNDKTGKVEFKASYISQNNYEVQHELSRFKKFQGKWYYLDGKIIN